ncbi:Glucose-6-phosphate isomerase [Geodia barretti]|uniref:Glucose-6-phosphate isomerase n=1 Tax=Geodia barretti TaxID=519541 RepID=A0AA35RQC9_GEOBA|nr:Glucose-6-phosphate isomerase [Geodia barretti]
MQAFAEEVKSDGFRHVVLLGMGGSSLGALALSDLFGSADGYPDLTVLDTTVPATISAISDSLDCEKTLFIVASKSGTTIEPNVLYKHFRALVEREIEGADTGNHFVAICDAGTSLERLAREDGFRRVFTNPPDLGGRYSVQSLFGLVPAALLGIDVGKLLDSVETMSTLCGATVPANDNPAVWLGALIASLVEQGRDKLTIVTTESLQNFALWVEQLLAESTEEDDTDATDRYMKVVEEAGIPVVRFDLTGRHNIGAEFFRWEFATAVAGSLMGIHPFDQPNVQQAKDKTTELLADYENSGRAPALNAVSSLTELMSHVKKGDYLAITAFAEPTAQVELALADLRQNVTGKWGVATTLGYGPRYLHSTGQLHKGGADSGLSLQLTQIENADVTIPGEKFTFGVLAAAQAKGDLDALAAQGRHVARINLGADAVQTVKTLANSLK